jgi:hypothetical protein
VREVEARLEHARHVPANGRASAGPGRAREGCAPPQKEAQEDHRVVDRRNGRPTSRRGFLRLAGLGLALPILAACTPAPLPSPTAAPAKPTEAP